ncbi:hypothetical protein [Holophaga foetida]|uniref:hypothetical protein n=1 Tax=Holophaga foetida TaxID=35839 RepID=UPI00146FA97C|nr:hypothetical protein [Holophaga foetida]
MGNEHFPQELAQRICHDLNRKNPHNNPFLNKKLIDSKQHLNQFKQVHQDAIRSRNLDDHAIIGLHRILSIDHPATNLDDPKKSSTLEADILHGFKQGRDHGQILTDGAAQENRPSAVPSPECRKVHFHREVRQQRFDFPVPGPAIPLVR